MKKYPPWYSCLELLILLLNSLILNCSSLNKARVSKCFEQSNSHNQQSCFHAPPRMDLFFFFPNTQNQYSFGEKQYLTTSLFIILTYVNPNISPPNTLCLFLLLTFIKIYLIPLSVQWNDFEGKNYVFNLCIFNF